jgi:excinuclease UvrABC nuclease subunit
MVRKAFTKENINRCQDGPGVYKLYVKNAKKPTYIGSSCNLPDRLNAHKNQERYHSFEVCHTDDCDEAREKEKRLIKKHQPRRNELLR